MDGFATLGGPEADPTRSGSPVASIDLNSDLGEGAGTEAAIMPLITSANVACGAHAGDETTMHDAIALARRHGVAVGAHPGYRDPASFGRRALDIAPDELLRDLRAQIETLRRVADRLSMPVVHVKAHGALYNRGERDGAVAAVIARAVRETDASLVVFAPPGSAMERAARDSGLGVAREGFIDRAYEPDGTLRSRSLAGALLTDPAAAAAQALSFVRDGGVRVGDGTFLPLAVETLCVHGDTPGAPEILRAARAALEAAGVVIRRVA